MSKLPLLVIPNWDRDFENSKSRQVERCSFFCAPNHFDGKRIRRLTKQENGIELLGAFHMVCAIASRCPHRGVLIDHDGPIQTRDFADKTGFPSDGIARCIDTLVQMGFLDRYEVARVEDGGWEYPAAIAHLLAPAAVRRRKKARQAADASAIAEILSAPNASIFPELHAGNGRGINGSRFTR